LRSLRNFFANFAVKVLRDLRQGQFLTAKLAKEIRQHR
jgi:hypothetical protein